jgi:hypothetical protein
MDPNETLRQLDQAIADKDPERAAELYDAYVDWLARGGFSVRVKVQGWLYRAHQS